MKEVSSLKVRQSKEIKIYDVQPLVSFFLVIVLFILSCVINEKAPFGTMSILASDLKAQYAPFLCLLKRQLTELDFSGFLNLISSFTYSSGLGMGKNMMGTFAYYMGSPLNLLAFLFDNSYISILMLLIMGLKLALAGSFMTLFLHQRSENKESLWPIVLGITYSFSAWAMTFMFCTIWLDGFLLLPLILFLIEKYMENGKYIGLVVSLVLLFVSNYYIAYMVGIYSFFYLLVRMYEEHSFEDKKKASRMIFKFILIAVLCALSVMAVLLPAALDTIRNSDPTVQTVEVVSVGFPFIRILNQIFLGVSGEFSKVLSQNLPFIFASLVVTICNFMFFVSHRFDKKTKILYGIIFGLMYLSFNITALDLFWQAFDSPNWFYHRYSFVFLPFMLTIALRVLEHINEVTGKEFLKTALILYSLLLINQSFGDMKSEPNIFLFNLLGIAIFIGGFYLLRKKDWSGQFKDMGQIIPVLLALLIMFETALLNPQISGGVSTFKCYCEENNHRCGIMAMQELSDIAEARNNEVYRMECEMIPFLDLHNFPDDNVSMYIGHDGISLFDTNSNKQLGRFLKQLGFDVNFNYFRAGYTYSAPATDAFLSLRYMYSEKDYSLADYVDEDSYKCGYKLYENRNVLPYAFVIDSDAPEFDFYSLESAYDNKDYFTFQENWYESMFPEAFTEGFYDNISEAHVNLTGVTNATTYIPTDYDQKQEVDLIFTDSLGQEDLEEDLAGSTIYYRNNSKLPIVLDYEVEVEKTGELYMDLSATKSINNTDIIINGEQIESAAGISFYSRIFRLGYFEEGDVIHISLLSDDSSYEIKSLIFATFNEEAFGRQFQMLDTEAVSVESFRNGHIVLKGTTEANNLILTSIPYEDGWTLYIDGKEAEITPYQEAFISFSVPEGEHTYELRFVAPGFWAGAAMSIVGVVSLISVGIVDIRKRRKEA